MHIGGLGCVLRGEPRIDACCIVFSSPRRTMTPKWCGHLLPATTARILSIPPAPSARNLHPFHPRLYDF